MQGSTVSVNWVEAVIVGWDTKDAVTVTVWVPTVLADPVYTEMSPVVESIVSYVADNAVLAEI